MKWLGISPDWKRIFEKYIKDVRGTLDSLFDALKQLPDVEIQQVGNNQYISSIHGEKGYYIYEVDGEPPNVPIDEFIPKKNVTLQLKKLVPVKKQKIEVRISTNEK